MPPHGKSDPGARQQMERENALRESEEKFRVLADTSPAAISLFQGNRNIYVNNALIRLSGYSEEELLSMRIWDGIHEDYRELVRTRGLARLRGEDVPIHYEAKCLTKTGGERWVIISAGLMIYRGEPTGVVSMVDITDRKKIEDDLRDAHAALERRVAERTAELADTVEALRESETRLKVVMELAKLAPWEYGITSGRFTFSDQFYSLYGTNAAREGGCDKSPTWYTERFIPPEDRHVVADGIKAVMLDFRQQLEHRIIRADGQERVIQVLGELIRDQSGKPVKVIGANLDITELKLVQESLVKKQCQLEEFNATLEKRVRDEVRKNQEKDIILIQQNRQAALGETLDHIAHQWKQPISSLYLMNYILGNACEEPEIEKDMVRETVRTANEILTHMSQTVEVFRDFYRPDKKLVAFRVRECVDRILSYIAPAFRLGSVEVVCHIDEAITAFGYPKEYSQVLLNILCNARDVIRERNPDKPHIIIQAETGDGWTELTIDDNAGGIPDDIIGHVFDLYFTTKSAQGGTGVGLYMSRSIIEKQMGGTLTAENIQGGARFRVAIPASAPALAHLP